MTDAKPCSLGVVFIISTMIGTCCVHSASLRQYKLSENEPDSKFKNTYRFANPDMLKALEYIESLRQQTRNGDIPDYDDFDHIRLSQTVPLYQKVDEMEGRNTLVSEPKGAFNEGDAQLFQIMVDALKQAEEAKPAAKGNKPINSDYRAQFPKFEINSDDYETYKWPEGKSKSLKKPKIPHGNYRDSLYKRTNEIIEEQYTPQNIATLESVFKELSRLSEPINLKKDGLDEQKLYRDDDEVNKVNNIAYEDDEDGGDWNPVEEKIESQQTEEEEIVNSKEKIDENMDDEIKRALKQNFREEEAQERDTRHQSSNDLPELINYLKGVMAHLENGRLKNVQNEDKRTSKPFGNDMDTQSIYQLIELSRELQIPPEDLIDMLQGGNGKKQNRSPVADNDSAIPGDAENIPKPDFDFNSKISTKDNAGNGSENQPIELTAEDVLNLLGTDASVHKSPAYHLKQNPFGNALQPFLSSPSRRTRGQSLPKNAWIMDGLEKRQSDYPQINDEEGELAEYLVNMLAKYPDVLNKNQLKRTQTFSSSEDFQDDEHNDPALKAYLNQAESDSLDKAKRFTAATEEGESPSRHYLEEDMLRKMLEFLSKDAEENAERHTT
ncbi:secretogranin-2 [Protopterus annectens]|uniref:secretogranin-2 n=1 Tax=Protopterus annectens TaxID=7888 RepID=UPI001CFB0AE5|nr:secretogranin-2 [Protopterus annectens]